MARKSRKDRLTEAAQDLAETIPSAARERLGQAAHAIQEAVPDNTNERLVQAVQSLWDSLPTAARDRVEQTASGLGHTAVDVASKIPATADWAESKRAPKGGRGLLALGLLAGAGAGAGLGLLLSQEAKPTDDADGVPLLPGERVRVGVTRARQAFDQGRAAVMPPRQAAIAGGTVLAAPPRSEDLGASDEGMPSGHAGISAPAAEAHGITAPLRNLAGGLKARWREASMEANEAKQEQEAESRHKFLEDAKRI